MRKNLIFAIVLAGVVAIVAFANFYKKQSVAPLGQNAPVLSGAAVKSKPQIVRPKPALPHGLQTYQIAQAAEKWPKILQATIDPPDVHVGDRQKLSIVVETRADIKSVEARIETDHGTVILPLLLAGPVADAELLPQRYALDSENRVVLVGGTDRTYKFLTDKSYIAHAQGEPQKFKYKGEWIVEDTHDTFYHTTFVVKDATGYENSITLAWSDACGIPASGNWTMSANCTISSLDGVDNGTVTISAGTLTLNAPFIFRSSMVISAGASIALGSQGYFTKGGATPIYLYYVDADGDLYTPSATLSTSTATAVAGKVRRSSALGIGDCDDANAAIFLGSTRTRYASLSVACGTASDSESQTCQSNNAWSGTYTLTSAAAASTRTMYAALTSACGTYSSTSEIQTCQPTGAWNGSYTLTNAPAVTTQVRYLASTVCSPTTCTSETQNCLASGSFSGSYAATSCTGQTPTTWYRDADGDTYGNPNPLLTISACGQPAGGYVANNTDCYDSNANAYPGSTFASTVNRGDGSFDYNCDGFDDKITPLYGNGDCINVADTSCTACAAGHCQQRTQGWRVDVPVGGCPVAGNPSCGQCSGYWTGVTLGQVITECDSCNSWGTVSMSCN